jgi:flagellar biosynthetic protein FlhB
VLALQRQWLMRLGVPMLVAGLAAAMLALLLQLLQTRFGIASAKLKPDWGRLNPAQKAKGVWQRGGTQFVYALLLLPVMGLVLFSAVSGEWVAILRLPRQDLSAGLHWAGDWVRSLLTYMAGLFLVIGVIDLAWQTRKFQRGMRMSKQEIREEMKEMDGNPLIKAKIRRLQRDLLRRKMGRMPKATPSSSTPRTMPWHCGMCRARTPRRACWPRGATTWRCGFARSPTSTSCRWSRMRHWRSLCTGSQRWATTYRRTSIAPWPRFWPTSIA